MRFEKIRKAYVLLSRTTQFDKNGKATNHETRNLANYHVYLSYEEAKFARRNFILTVLSTCNDAEPQYEIGRDLIPTNELNGYTIHYTDGSRLEVEMTVESVTLEG